MSTKRMVSVNDNAARRTPERWQKTSPNALIYATMRKGDADKFHFGMMQLIEAVTHLQGGVQCLAEDKPDTAKMYADLAATEIGSSLRLLSDWYASFTAHSMVVHPDERAPRRRRKTDLQKTA